MVFSSHQQFWLLKLGVAKFMKKTLINSSVAGILLVLLTQAAAKTPAPVSLKLATETNPVKAGAEVKITVTIKNETQEPITIADGQIDGIYKIDMRDSSGNLVPEKKRYHFFSIRELKLDPSQSHEDEIVLSHMYD